MLWNYKTGGIPDELFSRTEEVPITKEEVRSIIISKLRLKESYNVIDIGCGSGSITVELCLQCMRGNVYAIDFDQKAIDLTKENLRRFNVYANVIHGKAQDLLDSFPNVNAIVVGGTTGETEKIINQAISKLEINGRLVISTILVETMFRAMKTMKESDLMTDIDFTQISILKGRNTSTGTMMLARNPVLIISATKKS